MKSIPIWASANHIIKVPSQQYPHLHSSPVLRMIYSDAQLCIWSFLQCGTKSTRTYIVDQKGSVKQVLDVACSNCIPDNNQSIYFLFAEDINHRYEVYKWTRQTNASQKLNVADGVKPLKKTNPSFFYAHPWVYLAGKQNYHKWEITSSVWRYHTGNSVWEEVDCFLQKWVMQPAQWQVLLLSETCMFGIAADRIQIWQNIYDNDRPEPKEFAVELKLSYSHHLFAETETAMYLLFFSAEEEMLLQFSNKKEGLAIRRLETGIWIPSPQPNPNRHENCYMKINNDKIYLSSTACISTSDQQGFQQYTFTQNSIDLNSLKSVNMSKPTEMSLASYFNLEEYADLIFLAEKKEVYCCRQLFEYYSPKFKKLYSSSVNGSHSSSPSPTIVRLDHAKLATVYFLVQQLFHSFTLPLSNISEPILIDLMTLAQKFQIRELQALCEVHITITFDNFSKLYDYSRNCELLGFREELLKFFVIHSQTIIEIMPIGKVEELIRLVYSPECQHASEIELSAKIEANYKVRNSESGQTKEYPRYINYSGIVKNQEVIVQVCQRCHRLLSGLEHHRKNKSTRGLSVRRLSHNRKKDNNSS